MARSEKVIPFCDDLAKLLPVLRFVILAVFLGVALTSCERRSDLEIANQENILVVGNSNEPRGLDPHLVTGVLESNIIRSLFEGLCVQDPEKDGESRPGVATRWEPSEDFTEWTFYLNPKAKWSDGVPVTARDFVFSYRRLLSPNPNWPAKYASMLYFLENAQAYHQGHLGHLLCGLDPHFPVEWEMLKEANFRGDSKLSLAPLGENPDLTTLSKDDQSLFFNAKGLDALSMEELTILQKDTNLLTWPDRVSAEVQKLVIARLLAHHEAGAPDLWERAEVGVNAVDDFTLKLNLRGPVPFLPEITKHYTWYPVPQHAILLHGEINTAFSSPWTRPENIVSNGPFKLKTWRTNQIIEVEKNPHYWDRDQVSLSGIRYLPIRNYYTETRMFGDEQLHLTYTVPAELIPMAKEKYPEMLKQEPYVGTRFIRVNTKSSPFDNAQVRRAFALAINQRAICEDILQGGQMPASGIVPQFGEYEPPKLIQYDREKAKALLAESGYQSASSFPTISLLTTNSDSGLREAEALQAMWQENLGIKVRIVSREWSTYIQKQTDGDYNLAVGGWIGDYLDPTTFLEMWMTGSGINNTGWGSEKFEDLLKQAENTADVPMRMSLLSEAEERMMSDTPILPIYWYTTNYLIRPEVKNWNPLLLNQQPYKFISLDPR